MRTRAICLAAVLTACSDPAPEPTPPPPQANVNPAQVEFLCGNYASMPAEQVEACTSLIGLYGDAEREPQPARAGLSHARHGA